MARWLVEASFVPIALVYRAWGRGWLTDAQCRAVVTGIMRVTLWLARRQQPADA